MKLITYKAIRPGIQALGSISVRLGSKSIYSHSEIVFEPGDRVAHLMPDAKLAQSEDGALWCASATATDIMPAWSTRRAGRKGGVRFKRIVINPDHWDVIDLDPNLFDAEQAATWFVENEGEAYDWRHIFSFGGVVFNWIFGQSKTKVTCAEACAEALGYLHAYIFDPHRLYCVSLRTQRPL